MYKIAARSSQQNERIAYNFQERTITLRVPKSNKKQVFKLKNAQSEIVPAQRLNGEQLILELPEQSIEAGYYDLTVDGQTIGALAFNYDRKESQMQFYSIEELRKVFNNKKNVQIYEKVTDKEFINDFKEKNIGSPLWKYFIWAALIFLLLEVLIIRFLKKPKSATFTTAN
jgi:hypothetical protein